MTTAFATIYTSVVGTRERDIDKAYDVVELTADFFDFAIIL